MSAAVAYQFEPHERPLFPGGPFTPRHPSWRKTAYFGAALFSGIAATFGNALVNVNSSVVAGSAGLYSAEAAWLPAVFIGMNASANLLLVKARIQFGFHAVTQALLALYALATLVQLAAPGFPAMAAVRATSGLAGAALIAITIYDLLQVVAPQHRPHALGVAIVIPQFGTPLARMVPVEFLAHSSWRGLALTELTVALVSLLLINLVRIPPGERSRVFEPLDFATIALAVPGYLLIAGVLSQGRLQWWFDAPWLGWMLAAAIPLLTGAILIERARERPLLLIDWLSGGLMLRFVVIAVLVRLALAEQTYGSVGLLTSSGLTNDQLRSLFGLVVAAMALGTIVIALAIDPQKPERLRHLVLAATLCIALAAWLDSHATSLTRPGQLYLSQALIGFGTALFIAAAFLYVFVQVLLRGPNHLISVLVVFSTSQNIGGIAGSALLGTYQTAHARAHAAALAEQLNAGNVALADRLQAGAGAVSGALADPASRSLQGAGQLTQALNREAGVLAYDDTFLFVTLIALATAALVAGLIFLNAKWARQAAAQGTSS
ncbi:MAG: MFS transporter [Alphaproteobacteria bacterium]|nr:MFS transporter [Alphaproteobacteria bacterium]MBV9372319.1 MFS transporter [Alphaproteobacteria bacterium]MBV9899611.1 MFS transporter [Alphaproteobacteria bacterium]